MRISDWSSDVCSPIYGREAVVDPRQVGPGIVDGVGAPFGSCAAGAQVAVTDCGERLAVTFVRRVEPGIGQAPRVSATQVELAKGDIVHTHIGPRTLQRDAMVRSGTSDHEPIGPRPCRVRGGRA